MTAAFIDFEEWEDAMLRYHTERMDRVNECGRDISFQEWLDQQTFDNPSNKPYSPNGLNRQLTFSFMENTNGGYQQEQEEAGEDVGESC